MDNSTLAMALRKRQEADLRRQQAGQFRGLANQAGGGSVGGGMVGNQPAPVNVDWGSILSKAGGNFMSARREKQASEAGTEADDLNRQFMMEAIGDDPENQRLLQMAQAGIPGADQALAERVAPKKEAMGAFLQHLQTGNADPEFAAAIAERYGISPDLARQAAVNYSAKLQETDAREFQQAASLKQMGQAGAAARGPASKGGVSFERYLSMTPEEREAFEKYNTGGGRASTTGGLTAGQLQLRDRALADFDKQIAGMESQVGRYEALRPMVDKAFGPQQKLAEVLTGYADTPLVGPIAGVAGGALQNEASTMLKDYVNSEVLKRMAALGGSDSNEELRRMSASLPNVAMDKDVALNLLDALHRFETIGQEVARLRREDLISGGVAGVDSNKNYYKLAEGELMQSGQIGPPPNLTPKAKGQQQAAPQQQAPGTVTTPSGLKIRIKQ